MWCHRDVMEFDFLWNILNVPREKRELWLLLRVCNHLYQNLSLEIAQVTIGEGNGSPLQDSCLENPMDGGAWQAPWGRKELDSTERLTHTERPK